ncbi:MAG: hypothetical protein JWL77_5589, partial [Chthonomonadaceae bacterium]|nr:hypothetical protein [Chthonomonadaceae bacterium]
MSERTDRSPSARGPASGNNSISAGFQPRKPHELTFWSVFIDSGIDFGIISLSDPVERLSVERTETLLTSVRPADLQMLARPCLAQTERHPNIAVRAEARSSPHPLRLGPTARLQNHLRAD